MLGIDIGSKTIKAIDVVKNDGKWELKASGVVGYTGPSPDKMSDPKEYKEISDIIAKMLKTISSVSKEVVVSIPEALAFTRIIKFPKLTNEEVNAAVKWEAEQYIPIPVNDAVVEHIILDNNEKSANVTVLLVAAPKLIVEKYVNVVRHAGLMPVAAETELIALSRSMVLDTKTTLLLDMGTSSTNIAIVSDFKLGFSRSVPVAGEAMTRAVAQGLGVDIKQAEEYKKAYGLSVDKLEGKVKNALEPVMAIILDEIKKSVHFYQSDTNISDISTLVVTGNESLIPGLVTYLASNTGFETIQGNPFVKINLDENTKKALMPYIPYYGVAAGLAMREDD